MAFTEMPGDQQATGPLTIVIGLTLHIGVLSHQSRPATPSIGHLDPPIGAHFDTKHGNIGQLGLFSITGTSYNPRLPSDWLLSANWKKRDLKAFEA
jgi:hypothetical protein